MPTHAAVWIDHHEARIFHVDHAAADESTVLAPHQHLHRTPTGRAGATDHPEDARPFFSEVARGLDHVDAILLVGPSSAKFEFFKYLHEHDRRIEPKIIGIETAAHPTDDEIVGLARTAFKANDQLAV